MNNLIAAYQNTFFFNDFSEIQIKEILDYYHLNNIKKDQTYCDALVNLATHYRLKYNYKKAIEIGLESLHLANLENYNKLKYEISYNLYLCYKEIEDDTNAIYYLKMALSSSKKYHFSFLQEELYKALYMYYKEKEAYQEAFEYLEKFHEVEKIKREAQSNINWIVEKFGFEENDQKNAGYLKEYLRKNTFDLDRNIFMENSDGEVIKINIDSIAYVESYNKNLKIFFPNNRTETFKKSFKEFTDFIHEKFQNNHLFFFTNLRKQMVNLYWISRFDRVSKQLFLNVIGQEIMFEVSRSQIPELKEFLAKK
jgi:DNA-binding LytR/AlgR family response regulator